MEFYCIKLINLFSATVPFLHPLKTLENFGNMSMRVFLLFLVKKTYPLNDI